jgi:4-diphosphocytidyl-2-C-methyl-D-erythritol kinase
LLVGNDLEVSVTSRHPEIAEVVGALRRRGASYAAMSGSGSAVFGLFARRADASAAAKALAGRGQRVFVTRTLDRAKYQRLARLAR